MNYPLQDIVLLKMPDGHEVTAEESLDRLLWLANQNSTSIFFKTLQRIYRYGVTDSFVKKLNEWLWHTPIVVRPQFDVGSRSIYYAVEEEKTKASEWDEGYEPTDEEFFAQYAWEVAALIGIGVLDSLKRCEACRKFYIGGPRAKWCSDKCGSLIRVRRKRQRDRLQGMMI